MPQFENYRPEIDYSEQDVAEEIAVATSLPADERPRRRRRSPRKEETPRRQTKKTDTKVEKAESNHGFFVRLFAWLRSPQARILFGIFLGCLAIYFAVSFIGYFGTCLNDQSKIAASPIGQAKQIANPGGEGGARLSELLINEGFGLGSLVVIFWLGALSLKFLVGRPRFRVLDFTIKCIVALITVSLIIGLVTYNMHTQVNWGGYHGTYINELVISFIGNIGAVLLSIFFIALFVMICLRDLVNWIIRKRKERAERRRIIEEEKAAILAKEEEIRRMQQQENYDDLRSGETTSFAISGNSDMPDDEHIVKPSVEFQDEPLYEFNDYSHEHKESDSETLNENLKQSEVKVDDENIETQVSASGEPFEVESSIDNLTQNNESEYENRSNNSESDSSGSNDKMIVNVGTIEQSGEKRFKSDVEMFESHKFKFPPYDLLREGSEKVSVDPEEQLDNKNKIRKILFDFGIPITSIEATVGPTVTLYEIVPETGVKIAKIRTLSDDIALSLKAESGVRIIAPMPGKGTVGIEVANKDPQTVSMRTVIKSKKYQESKYHLPLALGSTISNSVYITDLAKMPHLLVAGASGQGKSVGLNAIVASLLYCKKPHEVKLVMIDPKQVEFAFYNKLKNYYMAAIPGEEDEPVITETPKVEATLNSLVIEMENRYTMLKNAQTRNIEEYNAKIREGNLDPRDGHKFLPYIVTIVDEFGDLVMMSKAVETPIARLAQKGRAAGMHVIIATQRPSTNVITGIIKANFPARISFKVSSGVDSKTILDATGAQQLIGRGDMLIFNNSEMVRVQCAYVDTDEVEKICEYVSRQPYPQGCYLLPEPITEGVGGYGDGPSERGVIGEKDPLFAEIARGVVNSGKASTSAVQRTYEVGFNRAGRIMDQLEQAGIVGPSQGGKPRAVLVGPMELEDILANLGL